MVGPCSCHAPIRKKQPRSLDPNTASCSKRLVHTSVFANSLFNPLIVHSDVCQCRPTCREEEFSNFGSFWNCTSTFSVNNCDRPWRRTIPARRYLPISQRCPNWLSIWNIPLATKFRTVPPRFIGPSSRVS